MRIKQFVMLIFAAAAFIGCASKRDAGPSFRAGDEQMPEFLNGPAAVLLTNAPGYSAHLDTDIVRPYGDGRMVSGALLQRQGRFVFQPDQRGTKKRPIAGILFIWDSNLRRGWTVSEALQGYAPAGSTLEITNVQMDAAAGIPEIVNNMPCHRVEAKIARGDGSIAAYKVWLADDLRHFPVRIQSDSGGRPMTLTFSDVRFDSPTEQLFNPPEGFVAYNSPVALMNELIIRETTVGQKTEVTGFENLPPPRGGNIYQPQPGR